MATSSSRNFVSTCEEIVTMAMDLVGALNQGPGTLEAEKARARETLNYVVQALSARGVTQIWARERRSALYVSDVLQSVVTSGTSTYDLGRDVLDVVPGSVFIRRSSTDTQLEAMDPETYALEPLKSTSGKPSRYLLETNQSYTDTVNSRVIQGRARIVLHPVPDNSTDAIHYTCVKKLQDFDAATNDPDAPPVWTRCLVYGLAAELAVKYGVQLAERADIRNEYEREIGTLQQHASPRGRLTFTPRFGL